MAFDAINLSEVTAGQPTKQELFRKIKGNDDDHETRLEAVEAAVISFDPITFDIGGAYWAQTLPLARVTNPYRLPFDKLLISNLLQINTAGVSGTTQIDALYKRGAGSWTSIFSTQPSVGFAAGDDAKSTNGVFTTPTIQLLADDLIRIDLKSAQVRGLGFTFQLGWEN